RSYDVRREGDECQRRRQGSGPHVRGLHQSRRRALQRRRSASPRHAHGRCGGDARRPCQRLGLPARRGFLRQAFGEVARASRVSVLRCRPRIPRRLERRRPHHRHVLDRLRLLVAQAEGERELSAVTRSPKKMDKTMHTNDMTSSNKPRALLATAFASLGAATAAAQPAAAPGSGADEQQTIVVTASRRAQELKDAPAAMTVIGGAEIERLPADDYGDLQRNVPGLNVAQTSVRDINMTGRGSTSTLANTQLVMLDGRSVYLDFFGFVMWDLLPIQASEIERIEVVRGPGSAVWGANAMAGVVNVIGRRPKDMVGTTVLVGTPYASVVHAAASDGFGYKVSAGYFEQPAYDRPTGTIPGSNPPQTYPVYENEGTEQSRVNLELEWETGDDAYVSVAAGYAETDGILHSGIGPFDIERGSNLSYV